MLLASKNIEHGATGTLQEIKTITIAKKPEVH